MKNNPNQNSDEYFNIAEEEELNEQYVRDFIEELIRDENFQAENIAKLKNRKAATLIETLPKKLREYLQEIQRLEKESSKSQKKDAEGKDLNSAKPKTKKEVEAEKQRRERVKEIAKEIFIISCASSKGLEKSMEFFDKCQLKPEDLSKFGECGLSPLTASLLSGKIEKMQGLIDRGANVNEKNSYGFTARDFAEMIGDKNAVEVLKENGAKGINSQQREQEEGLQRQKKEEKESEKKSKSDFAKSQKATLALKRQEAEMQRLQQEQVKIYRAMEEIYDHLLAKEKLAKEVLDKAQKVAEEKQSIQSREASYQGNIVELKQREVDLKTREGREREIVVSPQENQKELKSTETLQVAQKSQNKFSHEEVEKVKPRAKAELEKILQVDLDKVDINKLLFNYVKEGQTLVAVMLINCGANINHREGSKTIIDVAVDNGDSSMIGALSMFSRREVLVSAISQAIEKGSNLSELRQVIVGNIKENQISVTPTARVVNYVEKPSIIPIPTEIRKFSSNEIHKPKLQTSFQEKVINQQKEENDKIAGKITLK